MNSQQDADSDREPCADDRRCVMTLRSSGTIDSGTWGQVWEAATITTAMCTRQGKKGLYTQIGELHAL